jgi:hypothetical protein
MGGLEKSASLIFTLAETSNYVWLYMPKNNSQGRYLKKELKAPKNLVFEGRVFAV